MSFRVDSNICDPMIASCQDVNGQEVFAECVDPSDSSLSDSYSQDNGLETAALAYSNRVMNNVVGTVDGVRHVAENECATGVRKKLGVGHEDGFIPQTLIVGCSIGGMVVGTAKGLASLPGRVVDVGKRLFSGAAESIAEALADLNFFAIEFAGYGQMASGAIQTFKGGAPVSAPISGSNIANFGNGPAVAVRPVLAPALAVAGDICIASGETAVGVVAASSDDFGGPMATPQPVFENYGDEAPGGNPPSVLSSIPREEIIRKFSKAAGRELSWSEIEGILRRFVVSKYRITDIRLKRLGLSKDGAISGEVVFNGNNLPSTIKRTFSFRGLQEQLYRRLDPATGQMVDQTSFRLLKPSFPERSVDFSGKARGFPEDSLNLTRRGVDKAADFRRDADRAIRGERKRPKL